DTIDEDSVRSASTLDVLRKMAPFLRPHRKAFLAAALLLFLSVAGELAGPLILRRVIDNAIPDRSVSDIVLYSILFATTFSFAMFMSYLQVVMATRIGLSVVRELKENVFSHMLTLSLSFFDRNPTGKLMARVESDSERVRMLFSEVSMALLRSIAMVFGTLGIMLAANTTITLWILVLLVPVAVLTVPVLKKMRKLYRRVRSAYARISGFIAEYVRSVPVLQVFGATSMAAGRIHAEGERFLSREVKAYFWEYGFWSFLGSCEILAVIVILLSGRAGVVSGLVTVGTVVMFVEYTRRLFVPVLMFSETLNMVQRAAASAERLFDILSTETLTPDGHLGEEDFPKDWKEIRFNDVWFRYPDGDWVIRDLSFSIARGEMVALVGSSGGGKSTIVSLLLRFYEPDRGSITVDGRDIREFRLDVWRDRIGLVLQNVNLFSGTLSQNLTVFRSGIPEEDQLAALRTIDARDLLRSIPGGLEGNVSEGGLNLSMGQRQLINYARAVLKDPQILVLDEATSSVDPGTEKRIQHSTDLMIRDRTALVVAHRLTTVTHASKILVIQHGAIAEQGTHSQLLKRDGVYAGLCRLQLQGDRHA
ncbi:MAG: ATP-binding cassette domain-containing protein, partial [Candidatus Aegiribacteria sp.]|nr:ATP-binding cassette domain-containing protein [Candidatus Aegiribacteria sp.]MBD3294224.1 ATP-binding cassette domain-containing protein [Candidatus Fermentibacteria bacterium]